MAQQQGQGQDEVRAQIRPVKERVEDELIARKGVVAVDIAPKESGGEQTDELSIVVYVEEKKPLSKVAKDDQIPAEIDGVKTDVQELTIELQPGAMVRVDEELQVDPGRYTTLTGGISMGPQRSVFLSPPDVPSPGNYRFVGTLGAMVRDRASGATMALTNFHVACVNNTWSVGDRMVQPSLVDDAAAATPFGSLTRAVLTENTDGAVVTLDSGAAWAAQVNTIGDVAGQGTATVGMAVQKRGRTTEHTFGTVASVDFTVNVNYGSDVGPRTLRHQIRVNTDTARNPRFSNSGDSGSVVMDTNRNVVGLLFAGATDGSMTFANPIQAALDELSVDLLVAQAPVVTRPILSCLNTRLSVCNITTRQAVCEVRTRISTTCGPVLTRLPSCPVVTRPELCDPLQTRVVICDINTRYTCPPVTRECPWEPWRPGGPGPLGQEGPTDETFWAGYLSALEEVDALDREELGGGGQG